MSKIDEKYDPSHCTGCKTNCGSCNDSFKHIGSLREVPGTPAFDQDNYHIVRYRKK
jgi:hypothetical protein